MKPYQINKCLYKIEDVEKIKFFGVYKMFHIASPTDFYIGSTAAATLKGNRTGGFYRRWVGHYYLLKNNKHYTKPLQKTVNEVGLDGLRFEILEVCNKKQCRKREQYFLDLLNPALNRSKSAYDSTGVKHTEETKQKQSFLNKGKKFPEYVYDNRRREIFQFSKKGVFIKKYKSTQEAHQKTSIDRASINNSALGNRLSAGGYLWSYGPKPVSIPEIKSIIQYSLSGKKIKKFETITEITKALNLKTESSIRRAIRGEQSQAYGYKWKLVIK